MRRLYSSAIVCSSLLLFLVQPMMAKALLPRFGGAAGVWVVSMLFFQTMLLAGYLYAFALTRLKDRKLQSAIHAALAIAALAALFLRSTAPTPPSGADPTVPILAELFAAVGLPYFLLSSTSPLLQAWLARSSTVAFPYRLFALSNAASLAALLAYPVAIEPLFRQSAQMRGWSAGFAVFVALACAAAFNYARFEGDVQPAEGSLSRPRPVLWIGLAACSSILWLAVANHLSQEVAPVPFLWVLPLSVYLLSFILCFEADRWYRPALCRWLLPVAWVGAAARLAGQGPEGLAPEIAIFTLALFVWCMFCHGEIARSKPSAPADVTRFYLMIALGGALGAVFAALAAPALFTTYLELPLAIAATVIAALYLLYGMTSPARLARIGAVAAAAFVIATRFEAGFGEVIRSRNFYGELQVSDSGTGDTAVRTMYNGKTRHGIEFLATGRKAEPTAYYGPESGAGRLLSRPRTAPIRAGFVGLGAGTLASYGQPGDDFRFYEINPAVIDAAKNQFAFLSGSQAKISVVEGDGRLKLAEEPPATFDVLILDAFSGDSIPVHLLTREAFTMYFHLLKPGGTLAAHLTNRYLDLAPVVTAAAASLGKQATEVHSPGDPAAQTLAADWIVISGPATTSAQSSRLWTDDYSNLFQVLK